MVLLKAFCPGLEEPQRAQQDGEGVCLCVCWQEEALLFQGIGTIFLKTLMCFFLLSFCVHDLLPNRLKALIYLGNRGDWFDKAGMHKDCLEGEQRE